MSAYATSFRRAFQRWGRRVTIERVIANTEPLRVDAVRVRFREHRSTEVAGGITTSVQRALILAEDVPAMVGVKKNDAILIDGARLKIVDVDHQSKRDGDTLLAYVVMVSGG